MNKIDLEKLKWVFPCSRLRTEGIGKNIKFPLSSKPSQITLAILAME